MDEKVSGSANWGGSTLPTMVRYRLERGDFVAMMRAMSFRSRRSRMVLLFAWAVFAYGLLLTVLDIPGWENATALARRDWLLNLALGAVLCVVACLPFLSGGWAFKNSVLVDQDIDVAFLPERVMVKGAGIQTEVDWGTVKRLIETRTHLFVTVSRREALILPRRAFASHEDYQAARSFVVAHVGAAVEIAKR